MKKSVHLFDVAVCARHIGGLLQRNSVNLKWGFHPNAPGEAHFPDLLQYLVFSSIVAARESFGKARR
jgi:hypothetical protein